MTADCVSQVITELQKHVQYSISRLCPDDNWSVQNVWLFGSRCYDLHSGSSDVDTMLLVPNALAAHAAAIRIAVARRLKLSGISVYSIENADAKQTLQWRRAEDVSASLLVTTLSGAGEQLCITAYLRAF